MSPTTSTPPLADGMPTAASPIGVDTCSMGPLAPASPRSAWLWPVSSRCVIYIVSLSSVTANEENLASLFAELPAAAWSCSRISTRLASPTPATMPATRSMLPTRRIRSHHLDPQASRAPTASQQQQQHRPGPPSLGPPQHPRRRGLPGGPRADHDDQPPREAGQGAHPPRARRHDGQVRPRPTQA